MTWADRQVCLGYGRAWLSHHTQDTSEQYEIFLNHPAARLSDAKHVANRALLRIEQRIAAKLQTLGDTATDVAWVTRVLSELDEWAAWACQLCARFMCEHAVWVKMQVESSKLVLLSRVLPGFGPARNVYASETASLVSIAQGSMASALKACVEGPIGEIDSPV